MAHRNPNLVPKQVVNSRGYTTTVYTRPSPAQPSQKLTGRALPAAAVIEDTAAAGPGPLTPALLGPTDRELGSLRAFIESRYGLPSSLLDTMEGRRAVALGMDFADAGLLRGDEIALALLLVTHEIEGDLCSDALRVAAHLYNSGHECRKAVPLHYLIGAVRGARSAGQGPAGPSITTPEELHSTAAVVDFTAHHLRFKPKYLRDKGSRREDYAVSIKVWGLANLLREHPHDLDRIDAIMTEHGYYDDLFAVDLDVIRELLETEGAAAALDSGWL